MDNRVLGQDHRKNKLGKAEKMLRISIFKIAFECDLWHER